MRAILSVFDKTGIKEFAKELEELGVEIISSGGTYSLLKENHIKVKQVQDITGFAECLDGRVKTLHPKIHGGILANRDVKEHMNTLENLEIPEIDLVVVNLYPFKNVTAKPDHTFMNAIENIDIGGPTMIRSAAKNHAHVLVVTDAGDYKEVIEKLKNKQIDPSFRLKLAQKAFSTTAQYDIMIANYLENKTQKAEQPETVLLSLKKKQDMRYGENPHQSAAYYSCDQIENKGVEAAEILQGKALSYNNYSDAQGAIELAMEFKEPVCVAVKHATPCGVATADNLYEAYRGAYEGDPIAIFGGIIATNCKVDAKTATQMNKIFLEVIVAPDFDEEALAILQQKPNLRLLKLPLLENPVRKKSVEYKTTGGGFLAQSNNVAVYSKENQVVTKAQPTASQQKDLEFAMKVVKHVKSNAIVVVKDGKTIGIGGGQVSRIWAAEAALERAGENAQGAVMASDAFFPFPDVVALAAQKGIKAIIQPGGSIKDQDSIDECDKNNLAMILTGIRHFRH